ncbi:MAG: hypothetical protein Q8O89_00875 [Nanoarchaeota archaeon]|nr:hypothetical protein [Nanoarchaeota archaeon]
MGVLFNFQRSDGARMKNTLEQTIGRCKQLMAYQGEIIDKTEDKTVIKNMRDTEKAEQLFITLVLNYESLDIAEKIWRQAGCGREGTEIDEVNRIKTNVIRQWNENYLIQTIDSAAAYDIFDYFTGPKSEVLGMISDLSKQKADVVETIITEANAAASSPSASPAIFDVLDYFVANSCSEIAVRFLKEISSQFYQDKSFSKTPGFTSTEAAVRLYKNSLLSGTADEEFTERFVWFAEKCEVYSDSSIGAAFTYSGKKASFKKFIDALKNGGREAVLNFNAGLENNFRILRQEYAGQSAAMRNAIDLTKVIRLYIPESIRETELGDVCLQKSIEYIRGRG